jgi:hypothetical protein
LDFLFEAIGEILLMISFLKDDHIILLLEFIGRKEENILKEKIMEKVIED